LEAKCHLLPHAAGVSRQLGDMICSEHLDYILFFGKFFNEEDRLNSTAAYNEVWEQLPISNRWRENLKLVDAGDFGLLFAVLKTEDAA